MSNHKAKFWIKSSIDLFNKYAEQMYGQIYNQCQETYLATIDMHLEDNYPTDAAKLFLEFWFKYDIYLIWQIYQIKSKKLLNS